MPYIIAIIVILIIIVIKLIYDEKETKRKQLQRIKKSWGQVPEEEYTSEKFQSLRAYFEHFSKKDNYIDDITWNDIDMDELFMLMNNTSSAIGEEYLYSLLRKLEFDTTLLEERERLIQFFMEHSKERISLQMALSSMGKLREISVYEYINRTDNLELGNGNNHYFNVISLLGSILFVFVAPLIHLPLTYPILAIVCCVSNNIVQYYKKKAKVEKYFYVFAYILRLLASLNQINHLNIKEIEPYTDKLKNANKVFKKFKKGSNIVLSGKTMSGGFEDIILDYVRMLFHIDLIKFDSMLSELRKNKDILNDIYESIGILDSMIAVASFRTYLNGDYTLPVLQKKTKPYLNVEELYHPLIDDPVKNSIQEKQCVLITGSNASGKSTFIKTIALNTILAQTVHTVLGKSYEASFFKVYSSMALRDNLLGKESYYIVEIKSLKRILDQLHGEVPTLCFVDEVLRGTNTLERIAASTQILYSMSNQNAICFAATHDIELTYILEKAYSNYHFQEKIQGNEIIFDYKLHKGRAVSRNAIQLLHIMGYEKEIIEKATKEANHFLKEGVWTPIE